MKKAIINKINSMIVSSIVACLLGLIMVIFPTISITTIGIIASIYLIIHGIVLIVLDLITKDHFISIDGLVPGILSIIMGILLVCMSDLLSTIITIVLGMWIILSSINVIKISLIIKEKNNYWILLLLLGILDILLGIVLVFNPFAASLSIIMFIGIMIMSHAIVNIIDMIVLKKNINDFEKSITESIKLLSK